MTDSANSPVAASEPKTVPPFAVVPGAQVQQVLEGREKQVVELDSAETLAGQKVAIKVDGSTVMVGEAKVVKADVMASNGVIHVIDAVLIPEAKASN